MIACRMPQCSAESLFCQESASNCRTAHIFSAERSESYRYMSTELICLPCNLITMRWKDSRIQAALEQEAAIDIATI